MKITIYELLGLIKDGKPPKKIKYCKRVYEWDNTFLTYTTPKDGFMVCLGGEGDNKINMFVNAFNENVEILDEEDEFIDIKHYDLIDNDALRWDGKLVAKNFFLINKELEKLVKNQKKIIDKLKEEGK